MLNFEHAITMARQWMQQGQTSVAAACLRLAADQLDPPAISAHTGRVWLVSVCFAVGFVAAKVF